MHRVNTIDVFKTTPVVKKQKEADSGYPLTDEAIARACTKQEACAIGYRALCGPYNTAQKWMIENVLRDMRRANRGYAIAKNGYELTIYVSTTWGR